MPINKQKTTMLQIAVPIPVASAWRKIVKISGNTQGELFSVVLGQFLAMCERKAKDNLRKKE